MGLIIAFGIWRINSSFKANNTKAPNISPTPAITSQFGMTIAKPNNDDVINKNPSTISGITSPQSWVVASSDIKDYVVQTDANGNFEFEVELTGGINQIQITAFNENGASTTNTLRLIFSTEMTSDIGKNPAPSPSPESATEESSIREKVLKKVEETLKSPKAYIGTVTDITGGTIQIKSDSGEIKQISTNSAEVKVIKTGSTNKEVKYSDIAIGDYIVAMGYKNGNSVLDGKRILITSPQPTSAKKALYGKILSVNKKEIVLTEINSEKTTAVIIDNNTKITKSKDGKTLTIKLTDLEENDIIIMAGSTQEEKLLARRVHLVKQVAASPEPSMTPTTKPTASPKE